MSILDELSESLINELKGNLFEYLLGLTIANRFGIVERYLAQIPNNFRTKLSEYETILRKLDNDLIGTLPLLASSASDALVVALKLDNIKNVAIVGKLSGKKREADLIIVSEGGAIPLSVKLVKFGSFVNTKSGGIMSFISTYFDNIEVASKLQKFLNGEIERVHQELARKLYREAGLNFINGFDESWGESGYSELPGELPANLREIVLGYYGELAQSLHNIFIQLHQCNPNSFVKSLLSLLGFGHKDIIQMILFHSGVQIKERYQVKDILISTAAELENLEICDVKILDYKPSVSSFEIVVKNRRLQIRVKPMDKFTTKAVKINCSVRNERPHL